MRGKQVVRRLGFFSAVLFAGLAQADVVFSNITSPSSTAYPVLGSLFHGPLSMAAEFTPGATFTLTDAEVRVFGLAGSQFDVVIASDGSALPGSPIAQIGTDFAAPTALTGGIVTANSITTPITLTAGTHYWLVLSPARSTSYIDWFAGGTQAVPLAQQSNGNWLSLPAGNVQFQIDGTTQASVPEPISGLSWGLAVSGLLPTEKARKRVR